uniref:cytochrome c oxidase subunit 3 n=1 Tax=Glaucosphaera vacuolata TaxID=38265 RepID=UPI001FCDE46F|nr:cytochrome c oxidase subunit 3 [Glaucosphaera vacuolata]UNJ18771.1 cytochrome c oxidase subunit 3 [Glaucosphaera vacuolata]
MQNPKIYAVIQRHPFHLVDSSPWPIIGSVSTLSCVLAAVMYFHHVRGGSILLLLSFLLLASVMFVWWQDVVQEATFGGYHTNLVQRGLRYGVILFILSELMFFVAFFWAFFHSSLSPNIEIGSIWPPKGINVLNPWGVPFLNTMILLLSGCTVTWAHHAMVWGDQKQVTYAMGLTILLAVIFTLYQILEYSDAEFRFSDGVYGSTFYIATGFHGFHVIIGTTFLTVCLIRFLDYHFSVEHHFGFEAAAWYWHFVDVIWLFLFISVYWWGGLCN